MSEPSCRTATCHLRPVRAGRALVLLLAATAAFHPAPGEAQQRSAVDTLATGQEPPPPMYRPGVRFGSAAAGGPLNVVFNRGLSVMHFRGVERSLSETDWARGWASVSDALAHPAKAVERAGGWWSWIGREFFPSDLNVWSWAWAPNYGGHIVAGGLTYRYLEEWFRAHGTPLPAVSAATSLMGTMVLNEVIENQDQEEGTAGTVADLYVFDPLGILIFSSDRVARFFTGTLRAADWSPQVSVTAPDGRVQNVSQSMAYKVPLPFVDRLRLLLYVGQGSQSGLTYEMRDGYSLGATVGFDADSRNVDPVTGTESIDPQPTGSLFLDRDDSLLASLVFSRDAQSLLMANLYPGVLPGPLAELGLWFTLGQEGEVSVGIGTRRTLGLGIGVDIDAN